MASRLRQQVVGILVRIAIGIGLLVLVISVLSGLPFKKTPRDQIGISYGGGPIEGAKFQAIYEPGHGLFFNGFYDRLYLYPVTQRNYIISSRLDEGDVHGEDFVEAPSQDNIPVQFEVATYFKLNTNLLQEFHENIGLKYHAWEEEGWNRMLNDSFRQQIEFALQKEARSYPVAEIYSSRDTLQTIQREVAIVLKDNVGQILGDEYFCGPTFEAGSDSCADFTFLIKKIRIPEQVRIAFEDVRTSEIQIETKRNEIKQRQAEAEGISRLNKALEASGPSYVLLKAIESGTIQFWVIPSGNDLTLQAPTFDGQ